ncbi:hypothetical protein [Kitasatospora paranensis]|uniref:DUF5602 domain-containing protein n=1 Tax=Kitasatospora paranensis TaxID=258053 RepID=A0ABW2G179_9ACTN
MPPNPRTQTVRRALAAAALAAALLPAAPAVAAPQVRTSYGRPVPLGEGAAHTYVQLAGDRPVAIGVALTRGALDGLPTEPADGKHCFDRDGDGTIDPMKECAGGHEYPLQLPDALRRLPGSPLTFALLDWDPAGHGPPHVYDHPHFDVHFYLQSDAERQAIRPGPCGILINCDDYATATRPLPAQYLPADYSDKGLAQVAMGNHLTDLTGEEWHGHAFSRTFVYGVYDARITFLEPMVALSDLRAAESGDPAAECRPVKQPSAWQQPGWYPRQYCVRHRPESGEYTVSLEDFARHA